MAIITVTLATDEDGNITSTAADIADAINTNNEASAWSQLVSALKLFL